MVLLERRGLGLSFIASPAAGLPLRRSSPWCHPTALSRAGRKRRGAWGPAAFPQTASGVCLWTLTEGEGEDIWALLGGFKAFLMSMDSLKDEVLHLQHGLCWSRYWLGARLLFAEAQQAGRGPALCYESFSFPRVSHRCLPLGFLHYV